MGNLCISLNSLNLAFPPFGDHPPGSIFHPLQCVSYLKVICAHSWEYIEAYGDLFRPKLRPVTPLFLIPNEKKHPVIIWHVLSVFTCIYLLLVSAMLLKPSLYKKSEKSYCTSLLFGNEPGPYTVFFWL